MICIVQLCFLFECIVSFSAICDIFLQKSRCIPINKSNTLTTASATALNNFQVSISANDSAFICSAVMFDFYSL